MGRVIIQEETTVRPVSLIGKEAGVCWGGNTRDPVKNYKRGLDCILAGHGRTMEYPQIYMIIDGYSARVIRELYTHIAGGPTRLQASTRYVDYESGYDYITPPSIAGSEEARSIYEEAHAGILKALQKLESLGVPREDTAMLLPLGMSTKVVLRTNLRNLVDMSHQRLCTRAYWEYRELMRDMINALIEYGAEKSKDMDAASETSVNTGEPGKDDIPINEWAKVAEFFVPKCELTGFCEEKKSCGRKPRRRDV